MKGSIRQRAKGSWQIILDIGTEPDGRRRHYFETIHSTRKSDAQKRLNELLVSQEKSIYTPPGRLTVGEHLKNWLTGYVKSNCSVRTHDGYESIVRTT